MLTTYLTQNVGECMNYSAIVFLRRAKSVRAKALPQRKSPLKRTSPSELLHETSGLPRAECLETT